MLIFVTGAFGFLAFFSDLAKGEQLWHRILVVTVVYLVVGASVGALLPRLWALALLAGWGPIGLGVLGLFMRLRTGGETPYWSAFVVTLVVLPAWLLASSYLGKVLRTRVSSWLGRDT